MDPQTFRLSLSIMALLAGSQDIKHLVNAGSILKHHSRIKSLAEKSGCQSSHLSNDFAYTTKCEICRKEQCSVVLNCSHKFCNDCLKDSPANSDERLRNFYIDKKCSLHCPTCGFFIDRKLAKRIILNSGFAVEKKEVVEEQPTPVLQCMECKCKRNPEKFYFACYHMCVFCAAQNKLLEKSCRFCNIRDVVFNQDQLEDAVVCSVCGKTVGFPKEFITEVCDQHSHCYDCLSATWDRLKCGRCNKALSLESREYIANTLFAKCEVCENTVSFRFLAEKTCCAKPVCLFCLERAPHGCHQSRPSGNVSEL
jgi:hypothetical protein